MTEQNDLPPNTGSANGPIIVPAADPTEYVVPPRIAELARQLAAVNIANQAPGSGGAWYLKGIHDAAQWLLHGQLSPQLGPLLQAVIAADQAEQKQQEAAAG